MSTLIKLLGFHPELDYRTRVAYVVNSFSFILALSFAGFYIFLINFPMAIPGIIAYLFSTLLVFYFLKTKRLFIAKLLIMIGFFLQETSIVFLLFPHETQFNLFYFIVAPITLFIFEYDDNRERTLSYGFLAMAVICFWLSEVLPSSPFAFKAPDFVIQLFGSISTLSAIGSISFVFLFFAREIAKAHNELKELARTDGLTNIYNRRFLFEIGDNLFLLAKKYQRTFTLVLFDIDYFKNINDTHGHPTGDAVLKQVSELIRRQTRKGDVVARYGGEEFAIILRDTAIGDGEAIAEKLRSIIESHLFIGVNENVVSCTISLGVIGFNVDYCDFNEMVKFADAALYEAKNSGRNRLVAVKTPLF